MNATELLGMYEQVADAPDAVAKLRRFVLDLAVRGKLVKQDHRDEPAMISVNGDSVDPARRDELPLGWRAALLGEVLDFQYGKGIRGPDRSTSGAVPVFGSNGIVAYTGTALTPHPSIIVGRKGSAGALRICNGPSWTTDVAYFVVVPSFFHIEFLGHSLASLDLPALGKGVKPGLSRTDAYALSLSIPPLAEQHRIVAKVGELMALCDQLEAARAKRETARDRLAAASLARLNAPDPDTFQGAARFVLNALPVLSARPDQVKQLRQTILNLAVRGKLVPQDRSDEPVTSLLRRILSKPTIGSQDSRVQPLLKLPRDEPLAPYRAPESWAWLRAEQLVPPGQTITYGILKPVWVKSGVPTVRVTEMRTGQIDVSALPQCDPSRASKFSKTTLREGDLLISKDGTIGKTAFVPPQLAGGNITQHVLRFPITTEVDRRFIRLVIDGPPYQALMAGETKGVALQGVNVGDFRRMLLPIPPLGEQRGIVAKVDQLMALCDQLEASLTVGDSTRRRLLDALLHEALTPLALDAA